MFAIIDKIAGMLNGTEVGQAFLPVPFCPGALKSVGREKKIYHSSFEIFHLPFFGMKSVALVGWNRAATKRSCVVVQNHK
jgi:hypothetical protein